MLVSWRHILHQARTNLFRDEDNFRGSQYQTAHRTSPWSAIQPDPMREGRELLARELEIMAQGRNYPQVLHDDDHSRNRARLMYAVTPALERPAELLPPMAARPAKQSWWRSLAAMSSSGALISLTVYMLLHQGETGNRLGMHASASLPPSDELLDDVPPPRAPNSLALAVSTGVHMPAQLPISEQNDDPILPPAASHHDWEAGSAQLPAKVVEPIPAKAEEKAPVQENVQVAALTPQKPAPAPVVTSTLSRATEDALLERAVMQLKLGDIAGARSIFETLAQYGSPRGALGAAETYDPNVLAGQLIKGLKPDKRMARTWYEKAAQLGSEDASQRLKALDISAN